MVLTRTMSEVCEKSATATTLELSESLKAHLDILFATQTETLKKENARLRATIEIRNKHLNELQATTAEMKAQLEKLQESINTKDARINDMEERLVSVVQHNVQLESNLHTTRNMVVTRIDDLEQHGRKMCLRIEGIDLERNETNADLTSKMVVALKTLGAEVSSTDFVRLHRSGGPRKLKDGRTVAQTIVRFRNWESRSRAYDTRFQGTWAQRAAKPYFVRLDLTKRRLDLLNQARDALKEHPTTHADSNADCNLFLINRTTKVKSYFNSAAALEETLQRMHANVNNERDD